jgi:hypothetical protein
LLKPNEAWKHEFRQPIEEAFDAGYKHCVDQLGAPMTAMVGEFKPDRRAELLELASRLAVEAFKALTDPETASLLSGREDEVYAALARDTVKLSSAIIAEVDRVSGEVKA